MASETMSGTPAMAEPVFGGGVQTVLASPRIEPPPPTLEAARTAPGRAERIEQLTRVIEERGVKYVFFQQVSITGRVMGKGVVSTFFGQVAERGYQLVYGATANLFVDRKGEYIGYGPESAELVGMPEPETFQALMTTTVTTAMSARETMTMLVSIPRSRRAGRTRERRGPSQSSPTTKRELYSST